MKMLFFAFFVKSKMASPVDMMVTMRSWRLNKAAVVLGVSSHSSSVPSSVVPQTGH